MYCRTYGKEIRQDFSRSDILSVGSQSEIAMLVD